MTLAVERTVVVLADDGFKARRVAKDQANARPLVSWDHARIDYVRQICTLVEVPRDLRDQTIDDDGRTPRQILEDEYGK